MRDDKDIETLKIDIPEEILTMSDREFFEQEIVKTQPKAADLFNTWDEEEQLYTHPSLCFMYQTAKMRYTTARCFYMLKQQYLEEGKNG